MDDEVASQNLVNITVTDDEGEQDAVLELQLNSDGYAEVCNETERYYGDSVWMLEYDAEGHLVAAEHTRGNLQKRCKLLIRMAMR